MIGKAALEAIYRGGTRELKISEGAAVVEVLPKAEAMGAGVIAS